MLARPHELFAHALHMQYAIGAFNASNLEFAQAIIHAAATKDAPVIVQTSEGAIEYAGLSTLVALVRALADTVSVPVILHLDHGKSLDIIRRCIEAGYTSVMIDASTKSLAENIKLTREVVEYAAPRGVWVEAELGAILGAEGAKSLGTSQTPDELFTKPAEAKQFVAETGVNSLAVSVGTIHGAFTGQEYIRFELLHEIERVLPAFPLVVHGASGIAEAHLQEVAVRNVCKINVDTELRIAFEQALKAYWQTTHTKLDIRDMLTPARHAVQELVAHKCDLFAATGKAKQPTK